MPTDQTAIRAIETVSNELTPRVLTPGVESFGRGAVAGSKEPNENEATTSSPTQHHDCRKP